MVIIMKELRSRIVKWLVQHHSIINNRSHLGQYRSFYIVFLQGFLGGTKVKKNLPANGEKEMTNDSSSLG